jgi:hypothetical protein
MGSGGTDRSFALHQMALLRENIVNGAERMADVAATLWSWP